MKKALSVLLSVLVVFSMFGMTVAAEGTETEIPDAEDIVTVTFIVDGNVYKEIKVQKGKIFVHRLQPGADAELPAPTKESTDTTKYTFKHWVNEETGYETTTDLIPAASKDTTYVAVFAEEEIIENQSLWAFLRTIFERINLIFEYFAKVFEGVIDF